MKLLRWRAVATQSRTVTVYSHWGCHLNGYHSSPSARYAQRVLFDYTHNAANGQECRPTQADCRKPQQRRQQRCLSTLSWIPETVAHQQHFWSIWGASGWMLKTLHHDGTIPYWACFSITNVLVRTSLIPMVLHSAHTAARFAKVAPEVQFLVTIFQKDLREQQKNGASFGQQWTLFRLTMKTMSGLYQLYNVHPLTMFLSPFVQIPIFWYVSVDLRKIINGADPALAQQLTESGVLWVPDLTEADPWFGLPILAGMLLYANVEVAVGSKSLSGEATSKSNIAVHLKDFFQSKSTIHIHIYIRCDF
jgi:membrane protein insertase Oxa1/YidC/SpoIIIJ